MDDTAKNGENARPPSQTARAKKLFRNPKEMVGHFFFSPNPGYGQQAGRQSVLGRRIVRGP